MDIFNTTSTSTVVPSCEDFQTWDQPSDIVLILDTSRSFGKERFNDASRFFMELLESHALLRKDFTHVSLLTFAGNVTVLYDYVSSGQQASQCEMFGAWDSRVKWNAYEGENIEGNLFKHIYLDRLTIGLNDNSIFSHP